MIRAMILALVLPLAARAQIALFEVNGSAEVPLGPGLDLGKVAAGDTLSVRIRVRNTGTRTANISSFFANGAGFTLDRPSLPFPVAPGSVQDTLLSFSGSMPATYSANLQLTSDANSLSVLVIAAVVLVRC